MVAKECMKMLINCNELNVSLENRKSNVEFE